MTVAAEQIFAVEEIRIPDSRLALEITRSVRDTEPALLFHHSSRVYYWAEARAGKGGARNAAFEWRVHDGRLNRHR
jgi:hypothetical protein